MENLTQQIIAKLKVCKQQGLTFYQAREKLTQQGYTAEQISEAADQFDYVAPTAKPVNRTNPSSNPLPPASSTNYERLGNAMLADKERSARPFVYLSFAISSGYLSESLYRLWLRSKLWHTHGNPHFLWANNVGWILLSGAAGGCIAIICLKVYFYRKDERYRAIDKNLHEHTYD